MKKNVHGTFFLQGRHKEKKGAHIYSSNPMKENESNRGRVYVMPYPLVLILKVNGEEALAREVSLLPPS